MNKITLAATVVIVSATAVTGLLTKNKVTALQQNLGATKLDLAASKKSAEESKLALAKATEDLHTATGALEEQRTQVADATAQKDEALKKEKGAEDLGDTEKKEIADLNAKMAVLTASAAPDGKPTDAVKQLETERDSLKTSLAESQQAIEAQSKKAAGLEQQLAATTEKIRHYEQNVAKMGLTGRVLSVNAGWNFMVIDLGDKNGAAPNAPVLISRNGQNIARARITTVEPGTSIASIVPESMPHGQYVQPGDQVIFGRL